MARAEEPRHCIFRQTETSRARVLRRSHRHCTVFPFFPYPLGREIVARPVWAVQLPASTRCSRHALAPRGGVPRPPSSPETGGAPFQLGGLLGYVDAAGGLLHAEKVIYRATLSDAGFRQLRPAGHGLDHARSSRRAGSQFLRQRLPAAEPRRRQDLQRQTDLSGITEVDRGGDPLWSRDFPP